MIPIDRQFLHHEVVVTFQRDGPLRVRAGNITGTLSIPCKHHHLHKIMRCLPVARYWIKDVSDPVSNKHYPELTENHMVFTIKEDY